MVALIRVGYLRRVCKVGASFQPLHASGAKCTAYIAQPAWGWSVVALLAGATALYVGLGMLHGSQVKGRRGWEALPHREFWVEARGMVEDGVRFASGRQQSGRRGGAGPREPLVSGQAAPSEASDAAKEDRRRGKEKKQKREKKSRQPSRHPERAAAGDGDGDRSAPAAEANNGGAGVDDGADGAGRTTASGGGGRWVHVPG